MTRELEDFLYQLEKTESRDLAMQSLDDVWLADLSDEELDILISELSRRLVSLTEDPDDWYDEEPMEELEDWDE